jgi:cell division protein FtsI (penicillin-binding protein 3)
VGLAGESRGLLREPARWSLLSLPTMSIGQEISVTALQMVAAFGAVANRGVLMAPRLVRATFDVDGRELRRVEPKAVRRVISEETARTLMRMMVQVVDHGTGHAAAIPGYAVGGKTGTAQKMDPATKRYSHAPGVLSFVGAAPADDPRFVMLVMLDEPKNEKWGSEAAAPIFASIGREILRYLEVPPRDAHPVQVLATDAGDAKGARVLATIATGGAGVASAREPATGGAELPARMAPSGVGVAQAREPATSNDLTPRMPDLRGQPLRQALTMLAALGTAVELVGNGVVVQQSPPAGAPLASDAHVRLTLARLPDATPERASRKPGGSTIDSSPERACRDAGCSRQ